MDNNITPQHLTATSKMLNCYNEKLTDLKETFAFEYGYKILLYILTVIKETQHFSTLVQQFHRLLVQHYSQSEEHLYSPDEMEKCCESHAPGLFDYIFHAIFNGEKETPTTKRTSLQRTWVVAILHSLSFFRNQVYTFRRNL